MLQLDLDVSWTKWIKTVPLCWLSYFAFYKIQFGFSPLHLLSKDIFIEAHFQQIQKANIPAKNYMDK